MDPPHAVVVCAERGASTVHACFEAQVDRAPDAIALTHEGRSITYRALDERANRLAHRLRRLGVGPGARVALGFTPSFAMIAAMLGTLKAGGWYVPLDPEHPDARLAALILDARPAVIVGDGPTLGRLPEGELPRILFGEEGALDDEPTTRLALSSGDRERAYLIYTSGSTGAPKGVIVRHDNLLHLFSSTRALFHFGPDDVFTLTHSQAFDFSVWEIFGALLHGARLVIVPRVTRRSGEALSTLIRDEGVTVLCQTPSAFRALVRTGVTMGVAAGDGSRLRAVIFGGEALDLRDLAPWFARHGEQGPLLVNMYGITETTVHVTARALAPADLALGATSPIGRPLPGYSVHLLDERQSPVIPGEVGEMYVGGAGVADGYWQRPDIESRRFIPDPFSAIPGARLYRSGDRARLLPDGELAFLGRIDDQVKIRGVRVELGEVESALASHPAVHEVVVALRDDSPAGPRLVAYFVSRPGERPTVSELRRFLGERLPEAVIPAAFVPVLAIPLSVNGKADRQALPPPPGGRPDLATAHRRPTSPSEEALAAIWSELLAIDDIGVDDDFFELGGDSILATRIAARAAATLDHPVPLAALLGSTTVAALAARMDIDRARMDITLARPGAPRLPGGGPGPLSPAQRRLWFLHQLDPGSRAYHVPVAIRLRGPLDTGVLTQALTGLIARHEALRTTFPSEDGAPVQRVHPAGPVALPVIDLGQGPVAEREVRLGERVREAAAAPFDLAVGPLRRPTLFRVGDHEHVLLLAMHHLIVDGWSLEVLVRDLAALVAGRALAPLALQPADLARRARPADLVAAEVARWEEALAGAPAYLALPADRPRVPGRGARGAREERALSPSLAGAIESMARGARATPFMVWLAVFAAWLHGVTGDADLVVGTPVSGREDPATEGLIGFFANTLALRSTLANLDTFPALIERVKQVVLGALADAELPFAAVVQAVAGPRDRAHAPVFQVMFACGEPPPEVRAGGLDLRITELDGGGAIVDLGLSLLRGPEGVVATFTYDAELFDRATIATMIASFTAVLERVVAAPDSAVVDLVRLASPPAQDETGRVEDALRATPSIVDAVVRTRRDALLRPERVAYVVAERIVAPSRILARAGLPPERAFDAMIQLSALPLDARGRLDEAALARFPIRAEDRVLGAAKDPVVALREGPLPRLHLDDLLPRPSVPRASPAPGARLGAAIDPSASSRPAIVAGAPLRAAAGDPVTLVEALVRAAAGPEDRGLHYVETDGPPVFQSYAALAERAHRALAGLAAAGLGRGDRVILQIASIADHFAVFWACLLGGITPVTVAIAPSYEPTNGVVAKLHASFIHLGSPAILTSASLLPALRGLVPAVFAEAPRLVTVDALFAHEPARSTHNPHPSDVAFLQLSSGSTGVPKHVQVTHRGILAHIQGARAHIGFSADDVTLNWLPLDHVVPMISWHLKDLTLGATQIHVRTDRILADPLRWLDLIAAHRVTHTWAPNFAYKLVSEAVARAPGRRWDLRSIVYFTNGGEQVTLPVVRDFLTRLAPFGVPPRAMQPVFGMAETATGITYQNDFALATGARLVHRSALGDARAVGNDDEAIAFVDLGPPIPGVELRIAGREGEVVAEGAIGRLQVRGAVVTPGYLDNPSANAESFAGEGWFDTGDLGFLLEGRLSLTGREKEMIVIRGAKIPCHEIEEIVGQIPGVEPTFVAAAAALDPDRGEEGLALFFVATEPDLPARAALVALVRREVTSRLGVDPCAVVPLLQDDFLRTTSGKIRRAELARGLAEGRHQALLRSLDLVAGNARTLPAWFHRRAFRRKEARVIAPVTTAGLTVILADREGLGLALGARLAAEGKRWIAVEHADTDRLDPPSPEPLARLVNAIADRDDPLDEVIDLRAFSGAPEGGASGSGRGAEAVALGLLHLAQALAKRPDPARTVRLLVVTRAAQAIADDEPLDLDRAVIPAMLRTMTDELAGVRVRQVDLDSVGDEAVAQVLRERTVADLDAKVVYRRGERLVPVVERVRFDRVASTAPPVQRGGVLLIAGGLGGIGVELSRMLLEQHQARLVLLGRTREDTLLPERARALASLREAASAGGAVLYEAVDLTDEVALRGVKAHAEAHFGARIDGVIQLAGAFAERSIVEETAASFAALLRPRTQGSLALAALLDDRPDALFLAVASVNGALGGFAASAYAAGNRFLQHLGHELRRKGRARTFVPSFSRWDEIGMSRGDPLGERSQARGFLPILAREGLASLRVALAHDEPALLIGLDERKLPVARILAGSRRIERAEESPSPSVAAKVFLAPRGELEQTVAALFRAALAVDRVGIDDNFFDLGGHSLLLAQVRGRLERSLGREVPVVEMFRHPTVRTFAAYLSEATPPTAAVRTDVDARARQQRAALGRRQKDAKKTNV